MSFKKSLILAIVLLLTLLYLVKVDMPAREESMKKGLVFKDLKQTEISSIEITGTGDSIHLKNLNYKKDEDSNINWIFTDIKDATVEPAALNSLVISLKELDLSTSLPKEDLDTDLNVYGLKTPELSVKLKIDDKDKKIDIGKLNQFVDKRYLKISSEADVFLTTSTLYEAANKKLIDFRDKTPLDFKDNDLKSIELKNEFAELKFQKNEDSNWLINEPLNVVAADESIMELTRNIRNLTVTEFIDQYSNIAEYGLSRPLAEVSLVFSDSNIQKLLFAKVKKDDIERFYLQIQGKNTIFELSSDPLLFLSRKTDDFRPKDVLKFAVDKVKSVELTGEDAAVLTFKKQGHTWTVNDKIGDKVFIDQWLSDLSEIKAAGFPEKNTVAGFEKPKYKLSIELEGGERQILTIGNEVKDLKDSAQKDSVQSKLYFAAVGDLSSPFTLTEESYKKLNIKEEALLPQKISDSELSDPVQIESEASTATVETSQP